MCLVNWHHIPVQQDTTIIIIRLACVIEVAWQYMSKWMNPCSYCRSAFQEKSTFLWEGHVGNYRITSRRIHDASNRYHNDLWDFSAWTLQRLLIKWSIWLSCEKYSRNSTRGFGLWLRNYLSIWSFWIRISMRPSSLRIQLWHIM